MTMQLRSKAPAKNKYRRLFTTVLGQKKNSFSCPTLPRLDGKRAIVTGGMAGVGEFITRGLLERCARVTTLARGKSLGTGDIAGVEVVQADLAEPATIIAAVDRLGENPFDLVICNAGLLSKEAVQTVAGVERTFGINVLGHHILYRLLMERGLLNRNARIVMTTGDIYITQKTCERDIPFDTSNGAYSRSKLGNLWQVVELAKRYPELYPIAVHPGVVASGFAGPKSGIGGWLQDRFLISEEEGAQASLIAATQNVPRGAYWHNVYGIMKLEKSDPARDKVGAATLWQQLEELSEPYLGG